MNDWSDQRLLRAYAEDASEAAFAELVRRHLDFVYSAALRMVRDAEPAKDVAQGVFVALAREARKVAKHRIVAGWLHRTARNLASTTIRGEVRRRAREQEALMMTDDASRETAALWNEIAPQLDDALEQLREPDREALLLRYFQNKSIREVAAVLATSEDAAQKRVNRALERLRTVMAKRGVLAGAGGIAIAVAANAVKAAPLEMGQAILSGSLRSAASVAAVEGVTMLQKVLTIGAVAGAVGAIIFAVHLNGELRSLRAEDAALRAQLAQMLRDLDDARNQLAVRRDQNADNEKLVRELARLRAEVSRLRDVTNKTETMIEPSTIQTNTPPQIVTDARFVEIGNDKIDSLGVAWTEDNDGSRHSLLSSNQLEQLLQALNDNQADVLSIPRATTLSGREAEISTKSFVLLDQTNFDLGPVLHILADFSTNDSTFALTIGAELDELEGNPPQVIVVSLTNQITFPRGETLVMARDVPANSWAWPNHTNSLNVPTTLIVAITPEAVDPAGNRLPYQ